MAEADRQRWDERYETAPAGVEPTAPDRLDEVIDRVPTSGRALDVACGPGAQSLWAAQRGLLVDAVDISAVAIGRVRSAAARHGVEAMIEARVADLDRRLPDDLVGPYDLVIVQRFRAPHLYPQLVDLLAPDGVLVVSVLSEVGLEGEPGPFHAAAGELDRAFAGHDVTTLVRQETDGLATLVACRRTAPDGR